MAKKKTPKRIIPKPSKKRQYVRSKSTTSAKSIKKILKKPAAKKKTAAKTPIKSGAKKEFAVGNVGYYNKLKGDVADFYKDLYEKDRIDRTFLEGKTKYLFKVLKSKAVDGKIGPKLYKGFVNNLENVIQKPAAAIIQKDTVNETGIGIDYWNLELYIEQNKAELEKYSQVSILMSTVLGPGYDQQEENVNDLDIKTALRDVKKLATREGQKDSSEFLFFNILKSKDNDSLIFELTDQSPEEKLRELDGIMEDAEIPEYEFEEEDLPKDDVAPEEKKGKKKTEPEKKTKEKPEEPAKKDTRGADLAILTAKKESFQKDIKFNNEQITEIAGVIKILKDIDVPFASEKKQIVALQKANTDLAKNIDEINKKIRDL